MVINTIAPSIIKYPYLIFNSGKNSKLVPYMPAINVKGIKMTEKMVKNFIISFSLLLMIIW